jgi:hypothetical protein
MVIRAYAGLGTSFLPCVVSAVEEGEPLQFHILSFEGPDPYAQAGGIASRVTGLAQALADAGFDTHLWFVGGPERPGHETHDALQLHRWCQWISCYHPAGVYDGEEGKRADYTTSLPPYLCQEVLLPHLFGGGKAVVLAEEWHTSMPSCIWTGGSDRPGCASR